MAEVNRKNGADILLSSSLLLLLGDTHYMTFRNIKLSFRSQVNKYENLKLQMKSWQLMSCTYVLHLKLYVSNLFTPRLSGMLKTAFRKLNNNKFWAIIKGFLEYSFKICISIYCYILKFLFIYLYEGDSPFYVVFFFFYKTQLPGWILFAGSSLFRWGKATFPYLVIICYICPRLTTYLINFTFFESNKKSVVKGPER